MPNRKQKRLFFKSKPKETRKSEGCSGTQKNIPKNYDFNLKVLPRSKRRKDCVIKVQPVSLGASATL